MDQIHLMLSPWSSAYSLVFSILIGHIPWLVEMILVVRLLAVYPYLTTPKLLWFFIFIPLLLLKISRFVNMVLYCGPRHQEIFYPSPGSPETSILVLKSNG